MKRDAIDLGKVHIPTLFRIYLVPTLLGMLSLCAVTATDGIFVGRGCGSDALAAVNICISPTMVMMGIGLMLGVGASVVSSVHQGCKTEHHTVTLRGNHYCMCVSCIDSDISICYRASARQFWKSVAVGKGLYALDFRYLSVSGVVCDRSVCRSSWRISEICYVVQCPSRPA